MRQIRTLFIPYTGRNPYQDLLIKALQQTGVSVKKAKPVRLSFLSFTLIQTLWSEKNLDLVHLHWHHPFLSTRTKLQSIIKSIVFVSQIVILKLCGVKFVWTIHNLERHEKKHPAIELFFTRVIARLADAAIVHCESVKNIVASAYHIKRISKIETVPHGNYLTYYQNSITTDQSKEALGLNSNSFIFLFFGEIRRYKGVRFLIETFIDLDAQATAKMDLVIAGRVKDKALEKEIKHISKNRENIHMFMDYIADEDLQLFFNAADIVVFPYVESLTSGAVILALSFGKPIIASELGCIAETLDNSGAYLYDVGDRTGLSEAMEKSLSQKLQLKGMAKHNLLLAEELHWEGISKKTYDIYANVLRLQSKRIRN